MTAVVLSTTAVLTEKQVFKYEMFKEFCELCVLMKGFAEFVPAELEEQACEKALSYYAKKAEHMRYSNPLLDEYSRRNRMY